MSFDARALIDAPVMAILCDPEPALYHRRTGGTFAAAVPVAAIFDRDHEMILTEVAASEMNAAGHSTTKPVLTLRPSDLGFAPAQGDEVVVEGIRWRVVDVQRDGRDWVDLILKEKTP
jgi:hypothetical protein